MDPANIPSVIEKDPSKNTTMFQDCRVPKGMDAHCSVDFKSFEPADAGGLIKQLPYRHRAMMKSAEPRFSDHRCNRQSFAFHRASMGRVPREGVVNPVVVKFA